MAAEVFAVGVVDIADFGERAVGAEADGLEVVQKLAAGEGPGGAVVEVEFFIVSAAAGEDHDRAAGGEEAGEAGADEAAEAGVDGVDGRDLNDEIKASVHACREVQEVGLHETVAVVGVAAGGPAHGGGGDIKADGVVPAADKFGEIITKAAAGDSGAGAGADEVAGFAVEPFDEGGVGATLGPGDARGVAVGAFVHGLKVLVGGAGGAGLEGLATGPGIGGEGGGDVDLEFGRQVRRGAGEVCGGVGLDFDGGVWERGLLSQGTLLGVTLGTIWR